VLSGFTIDLMRIRIQRWIRKWIRSIKK